MKNTIAVVARAKAPGLTQAIVAHLKAKNPNAELITVSKISDVPAGAAIAGRGLPQFVPGTAGVRYLNVSLVYDKDATDAQKKAQLDTLNDENSTVEQILPQLGYVEEMFILPAKGYTEVKAQILQTRLDAAEGDETAYETGFKALMAVFQPKAAAKADPKEPAEEEEAAEATEESAPGI